ncbi:MAG: ABC transporter ATP-binding protein [Anaerolineales bacterium]|nr:energy-coupling factor ABC transporter ATP-binding protein [Anaerolineales bacterium]MCS7247418.1 energy-coupling factor ABC transporter ATP-binding protein [Anaerolineales bacterium]MDW8161229.1 ABC transporter ATP-binding protein [Anaerolineales bacterium]MDW8446011.1 ABC transporter ATP-binding protein [Anaerolineales bacterium]
MSYPLVWVNDLTFRYRDRAQPAIQDITFEAHAGELLLIAGASGCGKTTLLRCLNGLIPRSYKGELKGEIRLDGKPIAPLPLSRISQIVGTVLQDPERQILGTRVRNEVAFGLENLGLPREEMLQRIDEALCYLGIRHLRDRETFYLSGGEKQKVALAGVLAMRPKILLLDEPLASLDPASAQETLRIVRQMVDEGMCVLMVEHRVEDVLKARPDRVMLLEEGRIRYLGDVAGLYEVVNYREIKLPALEILKRARHDPPLPVLRVLPSVRSGANNDRAPLVRFERVSFGYETKPDVLREVSFEIHRGDVIAILGANGAGKTTLVKQAIGLLKPTSGRVLVNGVDTRQLSVAEIARTLGYVFQSPSHMLFAPTVYEELAFGPRNLEHPPDQIEKEVREALEIVNLSGKEKEPPLALSFGQQKRVSIAAILSMRSRILIMDEPTAGQDYRNYMEFMDAIVQLPNIEAILFITHDLDLAITYANRIVVMSEGRLVADGAPQEVLGDAERLHQWRLVPTSLLRLNLEMLPASGKFLRAEALAHLDSPGVREG